MPRIPYLLGASALALAPALSPAQVTPTPADPLPSIPLPTPTPTVLPTPEPSTTPTPEPTPTPAPTAAPTPAPTPTARLTPRATPAPTPTPTPTPQPTPTPLPSAAPTPTPSANPAPIETVVLPSERRAVLWPWLAGAALLLLGAALFLFRRRREEPVEVEQFAPEPPATPLPSSPPPATRARLAIDFRPTRAGFNLMTATVDGEVTIANTGDAPASDIRVAVGLQSAQANAGELLAGFAAQPIIRPATPPFALAPGEERRFRAVAVLPHDAIRPVTAAGRPMFVPLVAISARYADDAGERQAAQAFAVGVERVDSAKLAPLWLDVPPRSYDNVAARRHEEMLEA